MRFRNVGGYRHNFKGFYKKILYPMSINKERIDTTQGFHANFVDKTLLSYVFLLEKSIEEEIKLSNNHVDTVGGWTLEQLQELLQ